MLGRTHRFHGYNSLRGVYKHGRTIRTDMLSLRFTVRDPKRSYRVAVVVSRKVHKSAVVRNRIRRRVYSAVREAGADVQPGTDLIFTVFSDRVAGLPPPALKKAIAGLLQKVDAPPADRRPAPNTGQS